MFTHFYLSVVWLVLISNLLSVTSLCILLTRYTRPIRDREKRRKEDRLEEDKPFNALDVNVYRGGPRKIDQVIEKTFFDQCSWASCLFSQGEKIPWHKQDLLIVLRDYTTFRSFDTENSWQDETIFRGNVIWRHLEGKIEAFVKYSCSFKTWGPERRYDKPRHESLLRSVVEM